MSKPETITIDDVQYVRADKKTVETLKDYAIVRCDRAGVFAGYIESESGQNVTLKNARRLWYWSGAASLSQMAMEGTKKPNECKFPCAVAEIRLKDAIEVIPATEAARKSIEGVKIWTV